MIPRFDLFTDQQVAKLAGDLTLLVLTGKSFVEVQPRVGHQEILKS